MMGEENQEILTMKPSETKYKQFENWVAKQPLPVETAVNTVIGAVQGGVFGFAATVFLKRVCSSPITLNYPKVYSLSCYYLFSLN